jgi:hypothetical protein
MSGSNRVNTRARRLSQEREDEEEYDHTSSCSSAEGARRSAAEDARNSRLEQRPNAIQLAQEEADAIDAARFAGVEADAAELAQEEEDAAYAARLAEEEARARRTMIKDTAGTGQFLPSSLLLPNPSNNLNPITSGSSTPTPVEVDELPTDSNKSVSWKA